jgi:uncharacterized protein YndB with AHSA1/START domain
MPSESVEVTDLIPASAQRIYEAWLDGALHGAMTGGTATSESHVGGTFTAWDGYIRGSNLELEPGRRIVQAWRSADFPDGSEDSRIEIVLEDEDGSTRIRLVHTNIPEGQASDYEQGWRDHYFTPMRKYFASGVAAVPQGSVADEPDDADDDDDAPAPRASTATPMPPDESWEEDQETVEVSPRDILASQAAPPKPPKPAKKKPAVKAAPVKKAASAKKATPAKKPAVKKAAAKKAAPAKKKPVAAKKKPVAAAKKKAPAKKPVKRAAAAKKSASPKKKAPAKKAPAKKAAAKKAPAKKKGKR